VINTILIDIDGVIANFVEHAIVHIAGADKLEETYANWPKGEWSVNVALGADSDEFWGTIPTFEGAHAFIQDVVDLTRGCRHMFATSSGGSTAFLAPRTRWIRSFCRAAKMTQIPVTLFQHVDYKAIAAQPSSVIIEDSDRSIDAFVAAHGHAIRVPRLWNKGVVREDESAYDSVLHELRRLMQE
jgi:hypothetical protein